MTRCRFIKGRSHNFSFDGALHFRHLFRTFIDQKNDQNAVGVVCGNGVRDVLHQNRLTGLRACNDEAALALTDRGNDVDQTPREVFLTAHVAFKLQRDVGEKRRQVFKKHPVLDGFRSLTVDGVNLYKRKVAFVVFGRTHFAFNGVARVQIKAADLGGRNVDVVRGGEIARIGTSQKTEAVGKDFKGTVAENLFAGFGAFFENRKHEFLFAHALGIVDLKLHRHVKQLADVQSFEL